MAQYMLTEEDYSYLVNFMTNMQRRIDDPQRRLNPNEPFSRVIPPGAPRFSEVADGMPFLTGYQLNQPAAHHAPVPTIGHHSVSLGAAGPPGPGSIAGGPPQSLHTQTGPQHPANQALPGGQQQQQQQQQQQFQRLKVEDALSYLDQVKLQFGNQPQVYNDFLDIMKEFKSQTIDTPGVINRVSNLFKGHADLIVGFNTFLPPGYKIEVQCETINVHQPGQQVMSIAALAQSQAAVNSNRQPQKPSMGLWDQALATQASSQQKVGSVPHGSLSTASASPADHRSYHQSPRPDTTTNPVPPQPPQQQPPPPPQQPQQPQQQQQGQPVEFNHAINYVNKIKNRFQGQPDIYKQFLEILHTYQKEQRLTRDSFSPLASFTRELQGKKVGQSVGPSKPLTENEVYQQVANLFKHQEDLLAEFGQFLPDANGASSYSVASFADSALGVRNDHSSTIKKPGYSSGKTQTGKSGSGVKRPSGSTSSTSSYPTPVKQKKGVPKEFSLSDASKTGSLTEYAFFDKVRKALRHQEVYDNFLRSIVLFNQEIVVKSELVTLVSFFLSKFPDLFREFKDLLGINEQGGGLEPVPHSAATKERMTGELAMEIDFNTCKRYGASYRGIPTKFVPPKCSGRTALCREVLNDTWVSFPTWSEDSSFVTSRKTQYEENIYKCEDERFELDYVIESNFSTIKNLEAVLKKMHRMPQDEASKYRLDNSLGGTSDSTNRNSIHRIYGDKANDITEGLKKNPVVAVPLVLRRLKAKDEEWREAQKQFNKLWKEQNEKFYLKSLDHQCANFKQHDIKSIRSKSLLNQIETIYDERADTEESTGLGPMLNFFYGDRSLIEDAGKLIIHHVKRQTGVDKETKTRIKQLIRQFVPDLFFAPRGELSDDDADIIEDAEMEDEEGGTISQNGDSRRGKDKPEGRKENGLRSEHDDGKDADVKLKEESDTMEGHGKGDGDEGANSVIDDNDKYTLMICNTTWYIFLRLHHILCSRLLKAYNLTQKLIEEESLTKKERKASVALALRLRTPLDVDTQDYYSYFLDMVMAVLDGNLEASQYEDTMREMYGIDAYQLFTMDKVVQNLVRQVQHLVMDDLPSQLTKLYEEQRVKGGAGGRWATRHQRATLEQTYLRQAEVILGEESPFKFVIQSRSGAMEIDMLDPPMESNDSVKDYSTRSSYLTDYASAKRNEETLHRVGGNKPIYLVRNKAMNTQWIDFQRETEMEIKEEEEEDETKEDIDEEEEEGSESISKNSKSDKGPGADESSITETKSTENAESLGEVGTEDSSGEKVQSTASDHNGLLEENDEENADSRAGRTPMGGDEEDEDDDKGGMDSDGGLGDDEDDEKVPETSNKRKKIGTSPEGSARRVHNMDNTSIKFQHNSYHHMFVASTGIVMFRPMRLARTRACHKLVTQRKYHQMSLWTKSWLAENVSSSQVEECRRWMMGQAPESRSNRTSATEIERLDVTPYRVYLKYSVDWVAPSSGRSSPMSTHT